MSKNRNWQDTIHNKIYGWQVNQPCQHLKIKDHYTLSPFPVGFGLLIFFVFLVLCFLSCLSLFCVLCPMLPARVSRLSSFGFFQCLFNNNIAEILLELELNINQSINKDDKSNRYRLVAGRWFSPVSSIYKTDYDDITEVLLRVTLNTIILINQLNDWCSMIACNTYLFSF